MSTMEQVTVLEKYQPYPEYSNSKTAWIGDIPSTWSLKRVKHTFTIRKRIAGQLGFDILSVTQRGIVVKDIESGDGQLSMDYSKYQRVMPGDFAMNHMDLLTGYVDISAYDGVTSPDYRVFTINQKLYSPRYFLYLFQMGYQLKIFFHMGQGASHLGRWRLATDEFNDMVFPVPSPLEQQTIVAFLDYETARIDKLIAQQQRLIELLKEKRQAVISHAVTKGLNPDAPMKDSGVEWLGEVPEHWKKVTFKYLLAKTIDNRGRTPPVFDSGIPMLEAKQIDGEALFSSDDFYKFIDLHGHANFIRDDVQENDILFITVGTIGKTCLVPPNAEYVIVQNIVAFRCIQDEVEPSFLLFWLRSTSAKEAMISTNKDSILDSIKVSDFVQSRLFIPPTKEQKSIGQTLKLKLARMDSVSDKAQQAIQLMQERRTALISAAVTGKIDLRGWVAPTEEVSNG